MKTVSREWAEKLKATGWVKETYFVHITTDGTRWGTCEKGEALDNMRMIGWLPAPTCDEIGEEVSLEDLFDFWTTSGSQLVTDFTRWLFTTLLDPDKLAEVWIAVNVGR